MSSYKKSKNELDKIDFHLYTRVVVPPKVKPLLTPPLSPPLLNLISPFKLQPINNSPLNRLYRLVRPALPGQARLSIY